MKTILEGLGEFFLIVSLFACLALIVMCYVILWGEEPFSNPEIHPLWLLRMFFIAGTTYALARFFNSGAERF